MGKTKLNILPVPTFSRLGVNFVQRDITSDSLQQKLIDFTEGVAREDVTQNGSYRININSGDNALAIQYIISDNSVLLDTDIDIAENASGKLVQIFESREQTVAKLRANIAENASFELVQLYIGGSDTVSEIVTKLSGRRSSFKTNIGYTLDNDDKLDINLIAAHSGRKSLSDITVNGVLGGEAEKTFKGTIDFKNGSDGSKGTEKENVLMLSEKVENKTVPIILCAEEDVEGNHGATIGRIDDRQAFYMRSRGIPEDKLYELVARARLRQVISAVGDSQTESRIYKALDWSEDDE